MLRRTVASGRRVLQSSLPRYSSDLVPSPPSNSLVLGRGSTFGAVKKALEVTAIDMTKTAGSFAYRVKGSDMQFLEVDLEPQEGVRAEVGSLFYMQDGVEFETTTGGGLMSGFRRWMTGESFFISDFVNQATETRTVSFSPHHPTKIVPVFLPEHGGKIIAQKGAFLCGSRDTVIEMFFTKTFTAGFFGGEGFILQSLAGEGVAFLKGGGGMFMHELKDGEALRVSGGSLVAFESTCDFSVDMVKGGKNIIFGGEGLFLSRIVGPGKVWLQGMPFDKMAEAISARIPRGGGGFGVPIGGGGGSGGGTESGGEVEGEQGGEESLEAGGDGGGEPIPPIEKPAAQAGGGGSWWGTLFGDDEEDQ